MEIIFTKTKELEIYAGDNLNLYPDDKADINPKTATSLMTDFPNNFQFSDMEKKDNKDGVKAVEIAVAKAIKEAREAQAHRKAVETKDKKYENKAVHK